MALEMGPSGPPRDPKCHPELAGQKLLGDRDKEVTPSPNAETLPLTPTPPGPTVTGYQPHRPTLFPMVSRPGKTGRTPADTVVHGRTKVTGKANTNGWRHTKPTPKVKAKHTKAAKWLAKHGSKV